MEHIAKMTREAMHDFTSQQDASTTATMDHNRDMPHAQQVKEMRQILKKAGTDLAQNDRDSYGDGDQRTIKTAAQRDSVRAFWASGGDLDSNLPGSPSGAQLTMFGASCLTGQLSVVKDMLAAAAAESPEALAALLERRETMLRLTPIMLVLVGQPRINIAPGMLGPRMDHEGIVAVLLRYGARPRAKCVVGKTAVHYGASPYVATPTTVAIVTLCIEASNAGPPPGTNVVLVGLSKAELNGKRGVVRGYIRKSGRRTVTFSDKTSDLAVKPANIALEGARADDGSDGGGGGAAAAPQPADGASASNQSAETPLVDAQDRFGEVALTACILSDRPELITLLAETHGASGEIDDADGISPAKLMQSQQRGFPDTCAELARIMTKRNVKNIKAKRLGASICSHCGAKPQGKKRFNICKGCHVAAYCNTTCQTAAWKVHKPICKAAAASNAIKIQPIVCEGLGTSDPHTGKHRPTGTFVKPAGVAVDEMFYVKVQRDLNGSVRMPHMVYDKTRELQFMLGPGTPAYDELAAVIKKDGTLGNKAHFKCKFDAAGNAYICPNLMANKSW